MSRPSPKRTCTIYVSVVLSTAAVEILSLVTASICITEHASKGLDTLQAIPSKHMKACAKATCMSSSMMWSIAC